MSTIKSMEYSHPLQFTASHTYTAIELGLCSSFLCAILPQQSLIFRKWCIPHGSPSLHDLHSTTFRCIGQVFVSFQYDIMVRSFLTHLGMKLLILFLFNLLLLDLKVYLSNCNHQYYSCIEYAELQHYV